MERDTVRRVHVIDSHTEGEPTRLVVTGGPPLGGGSMAARRERFRSHYDAFRRAVVTEPRSSPVTVGAMLLEPEDRRRTAGLIFFNNVGYLGMCGHGTIGAIVSLAHLGRVSPGPHTIETPAGAVGTELGAEGRVTVDNVPSFRWRAGVTVEVPSVGPVVGDLAWGGNWFFLTDGSPAPLRRAHADELTAHAVAIRDALLRAGVAGPHGEEIDHIEIEAAPERAENDARNFVLCPGGMYDRSPCGTGTSAKIACLAAEGRLAPGEVWRQEGILGGVFEAQYSRQGEEIRPRITGTAHVIAESDLLFDEDDPFREGVPE